jgi:hypothetical protein
VRNKKAETRAGDGLTQQYQPQKTMSDKNTAPQGVGSTGGSASGPTVEEALQYADGLPADCWADRCIIELADEVQRLREGLRALETMQTDPVASKIAKHYLGLSAPNTQGQTPAT